MDLLETAIMAKKTQYVPPEPPAVEVAPKNLAVAVSAKELFSTPRPTVNLETGEPEEPTPPNDYETENVLADAAMYEAVGLGFVGSGIALHGDTGTKCASSIKCVGGNSVIYLRTGVNGNTSY
mgnify:CR=1 FL=1